jgi:DNA-directed RNA polymerase subunit F
VKEVLEKKEKDKELGYEQKNAVEHLKKFSKVQQKKAEEMKAELSTITKLREKHVINIINLLPKDKEDLAVIFANENIELSDEEKKKITDIVKSAL